MKQLGMAFNLYLDDYDERLPGGAPYGSGPNMGDWVGMTKWGEPCSSQYPMRPEDGSLFPYVKNVQVLSLPFRRKDQALSALLLCQLPAHVARQSIYRGTDGCLQTRRVRPDFDD